MTMLAEWLTELPDRYDHETRLLPFLLNGLNDPVQVWPPTPFHHNTRLSVRCKAKFLSLLAPNS